MTPDHAGPPGKAEGAARMRADIVSLRETITENARKICEILGPGRKVDAARLNLLLLETARLVHDGHRLLADGGRLRAEDLEAAAGDRAAGAEAARAWAQLGMPVNQLRLELNRWPVIDAMLRPQVRHRRQPLIDDPDRLPPVAAMRERVSDRLFAQLHALLNEEEQDPAAREHGCFADIPLAQSLFLREMHAARRCLIAARPGRPMRFLDIGCGAGLKVISAAPYFDRCAGLEYDPGYAARARGLFAGLPHDRCRVIEGDALSFAGYGDFDVLYFFRPMRDDATLARLEARIAAGARPGTLLVAPYRIFATRAADLGCAHVAGHVWLAGADARRADRLRRAAEAIGTGLPLDSDGNVPLVWDPLVRASRLRGHEPGLAAGPRHGDPNG
ncbi:methyltransferase domain-containing protein [Mangrovicoccus algicola]|uniref:Class I SAM-dependent methyltransferase n=1 Tax=Mangrovicoccus algicola TaxID=2771008 RepID=A0A8J7D0L5_9RHOB|nr:class I SAM-dependent methyltransferase [Mangrovicoccus algicola]MBE3639613.1 class I SAM-dependent methyltransferase [Mangrovicoccus algicola]